MKKSVLFIHGFGGGKYEYKPVIKFLKDHGDFVCYEFEYNEKFGLTSLKLIAEKLHKYVSEFVKEPEIYIIGFSQGGIIVRYYIRHFSDKKVKKCITLCTPHKGSLIASVVGVFPGIKELQPNSQLLKELDTKTDYYAVYNPLDLMVFPGWRARLDCAKENKMIFSFSHQLTFWRKKTLKYILSILEK